MYRSFTLVSICLAALACAASAPSGAGAYPGDLDPTFGTAGIVTTDFGGEDLLNDVAVQPDGKILAVGLVTGRLGAVRYNPDGSLDPTWGGDGTVVTSIGPGRLVAAQPDGRVVVFGTTNTGPNPQNLLILRYLPDGSLDPSFDGDGSVVADFGAIEGPGGLALAPDGSIYAGVQIIAGGEEDLAVARFLPDGTLDLGFGAGGGAAIDLGHEEQVSDIALQPDGKIVGAGIADTNAGFDEVVFRLNPDGSPDPGFAGDGVAITDRGGFEGGFALALQDDGKVVVGGVAEGPVDEDASISRYLPDGSLDPAFAGGGYALTDLGGNDGVGDLAIQPDGKLVLASGVGFGAVRMTSDGLLDPEFGTGGGTAVDFGTEARESALALQRDGAIVVGGTVGPSGDQQNFGLARFAGGDPIHCAGRLATIVATAGTRTAGTAGADVIAGTDGANRIKSGKGKDLVCALGAKDRVNTGGGKDTVIGGKGRDVIRGGPGKDLLKGGAANDTLNGGPARDRLVGGKGKRDRCKARPGNDRVRGC